MVMTGFALPLRGAQAQDEETEFTSAFRLEDCEFKAKGENPYFILKPGYQLEFEGEEDGETLRLEITVSGKQRRSPPLGIGDVETRVVEEVETADGELVEVSRNFFAICQATNDAYYFGEEVDIYNEDGKVTHEGAWRAGKPDEDGLAEPGLITPGTFLLGLGYYHDIAGGIALDCAEHIAMGLEVTVPAGTFTDCVQVIETTPLEPGSETEKIYCPEVGLGIDNSLELVEYDFVNRGGNDEGDKDDA